MSTEYHKISIGSDHKGFELKKELKEFLESKGHKVFDLGTKTTDSVDYPDYAHEVTEHLEENLSDFGILICGTGIGMSIAANRNSHIRAALCYTENMAKLSRAHNDANILVIGAKITAPDEAKAMLSTFLDTRFEGGRHSQRLSKIR